MTVASSYARRDFLRLGGVLAVAMTAGCSLFQDSGSTELILHNARTEEVRVMVTVTNPDRDEPILASVIETISDGGPLTVSDKIPRQNGHHVSIDIDDLDPASTFDWEHVEEPLHVIIHQEDIVFTVETSE